MAASTSANAGFAATITCRCRKKNSAKDKRQRAGKYIDIDSHAHQMHQVLDPNTSCGLSCTLCHRLRRSHAFGGRGESIVDADKDRVVRRMQCAHHGGGHSLICRMGERFHSDAHRQEG